MNFYTPEKGCLHLSAEVWPSVAINMHFCFFCFFIFLFSCSFSSWGILENLNFCVIAETTLFDLGAVFASSREIKSIKEKACEIASVSAKFCLFPSLLKSWLSEVTTVGVANDSLHASVQSPYQEEGNVLYALKKIKHDKILWWWNILLECQVLTWTKVFAMQMNKNLTSSETFFHTAKFANDTLGFGNIIVCVWVWVSAHCVFERRRDFRWPPSFDLRLQQSLQCVFHLSLVLIFTCVRVCVCVYVQVCVHTAHLCFDSGCLKKKKS